MKKNKILITGGAGFIGSNLVDFLIKDERVSLIRVIDDLSNGSIENIKEHLNNPKFEFIEGDIRDLKTCMLVCKEIDKVSHQAALGSVPRSIKNPVLSTEVNILGTVNIMHAAVNNNVERVVLAFSSSTYGNNQNLPKVENIIGNPLSPYAVTKSSIEHFADVFGRIYGLKWVGLRYFNVFGPKQNPDNPYAAVIPLFIKAVKEKSHITIFGDGKTTRDFTYVENAIQSNELGLFSENKHVFCQTFNVARGEQTSLNSLAKMIMDISKSKVKIKYLPFRDGDVKHSLADLTKSRKILGYDPTYSVKDGLKKMILN